LKLELSLPERPGLLHAVPVFDLFVVLWLLFLLSSALVRQSGLTVNLPPSRFQLERFEDTIVVTLGPGESKPSIHLGRDMVTMPELVERFGKLKADGAQASSVVLLQSDRGAPVGFQRQLTEMILGMGFRMAMVGEVEAYGDQPEPPATPKLEDQ